MQDESWKKQEGITHVIDRYGGRTPLQVIARQEQAVACEAIFLLCTARTTKRALPKDVSALVQCLGKLGTVATQAGVRNVTTFTSAVHVFVALATILSPKWPTADGTPPGDDEPLASIVGSGEVVQAFGAMPTDGAGFSAAARLAFGVATVAFFDKAETREVTAAIHMVSKSLDASVFSFLVCRHVLLAGVGS
jgi:hypothetical protein